MHNYLKMNTALQLHNAARKYCIDRQSYLYQRYQKLQEECKARTGFRYRPRSSILTGILNEIERLDADQLPEYSDLSELLLIAGEIAEIPLTESPLLIIVNRISVTPLTKSPISEIDAAAIQDERDRFVKAVRSFTPASIANVPLLPYQRVLEAAEVASLWKRVEAQWGANGSYFYPLAKLTDSSLRAFEQSAFDEAFPAERLESILSSWGIERVYELREYGDENFLMSIDYWEPCYNGAEGFWFSDALNWIMYASHEQSITTGGILTDAILSEWRDAEQHLYQYCFCRNRSLQ